jgi:CRP-like cAMP-binding protein
VYASLSAGAFFGETGLVFRSERNANVVAASFCVLYVITKDVLDNELRGCDFDADATVTSLARCVVFFICLELKT